MRSPFRDFDEDLPGLKGDTILDPLLEATRSICGRLERRIDPVSGWFSSETGVWTTIFAMVLSSAHTMAGSLFLVADSRLDDKEAGTGPGPFPAQAIMVQRGLLEALGNLMAILEHPPTRDLLFRGAGYRENLVAYQERKGTKTGPRWESWFKWAEEGLQQGASLLSLTPVQAADPKHFKTWPLPGALKTQKDVDGRPWLSGQRLEVVKALYDDSYGPDSLITHHKAAALGMALHRHWGIDRNELAKIRTLSAFRAANFHCAVLTEVEAAMTWSASSTMPTLQRVWDILVPGFEPSATIYSLRYKDLLNSV